eukprot:9500469-Pyramimonas_sp.AAC.1
MYCGALATRSDRARSSQVAPHHWRRCLRGSRMRVSRESLRHARRNVVTPKQAKGAGLPAAASAARGTDCRGSAPDVRQARIPDRATQAPAPLLGSRVTQSPEPPP